MQRTERFIYIVVNKIEMVSFSAHLALRLPHVGCSHAHFKVNQQVSILTLGGRVVVSYQGYHEHIALLQQGAEIGTAKLWYDQPRKQYYLLVSFEVERPDPTPQQHTPVIGVDVGVRYLAVTSDYKGEPTFHSGKQVRNRANHDARLRKRLQRKGTRSAHAPQHRSLDLNAKKSKRQSERALRGCLRMCRWLMDAQLADGVYSAYELLMAQEFPEWRPAANTVEMLRAARQHTGESFSLQEGLEPPEK